jgi:hypothetical protein
VRRAVLILAAALAALLVAVPVASAAEAPIRDAKFELHEGGFLVAVKSEITEEKVELSLYRHGEVALYETDAEITDDTVKARFGQLGELDYTFTPVDRARRCGEIAEGTFEGTFVFTGENEYVKFEAPRARGTFLAPPAKGCKEGRRATASRMTAAKAKPKARKEEASLLVHDNTRPLRSMVVFEGEAKHHRRHVFFSAFQYEKVEGMLIARGAQQIGPPRDFTWNLKAGTARVAPPAPFTGSATFERRPGAKPRWSGSLRVPLLGGQPFPLAGGEFQAQLIKGSILD